MKRGERAASAWGGPEVGSRTWCFQVSCWRRRPWEGRSEGPHPPAPSLTYALRDVLGPLPPDTADPDQEGVAWLQQVEQGSLQGTVP